MDRNAYISLRRHLILVALRKESVDRNCYSPLCCVLHSGVALRKESVDRNKKMFDAIMQGDPVALRKESVDRNGEGAVYIGVPHWSLSARRAWIEILVIL